MNERSLVAVVATLLLSTAAQAAPPEAAPASPTTDAAPSDAASSKSAPSEAAPSEEPEARESAGRVLDARTAVTLALRQNPTLGSADIDVERAKQGVLAQEGRYPLVFQANAGATRSNTPRLLSGDRVASMDSRTYEMGAGLKRTFASGGTAEVKVSGDRFETRQGSVSNMVAAQQFNQGTGFGATGRISMTQPLLRGAGTDVGEVDLRAARQARTQAEQAKRRVASQLVRDVLVAYWELWYATEGVRIEEAALELARKQERDAQSRVGQGSLAAADALTFSTKVAELEESVVSAEATRLSKSLELERLTGVRAEGGELRAASGPPTTGTAPSRAELEAALKSDSIELAELESQIETARLRAEVAGDAQRARLDVEGYAESRGVSENIPGAFERAGQANWVTAHVGLTFELPLDDSRRRAEKTDALLAVSSAKKSLQSARDRVAADAALGVANERASRRRLALAERTRELAQKTFQAEEERYRLGLSIPVQVQQAQDNVRRAELREARARVDLVEEQTQLLHYVGKLLSMYQ